MHRLVMAVKKWVEKPRAVKIILSFPLHKMQTISGGYSTTRHLTFLAVNATRPNYCCWRNTAQFCVVSWEKRYCPRIRFDYISLLLLFILPCWKSYFTDVPGRTTTVRCVTSSENVKILTTPSGIAFYFLLQS